MNLRLASKTSCIIRFKPAIQRAALVHQGNFRLLCLTRKEKMAAMSITQVAGPSEAIGDIEALAGWQTR